MKATDRHTDKMDKMDKMEGPNTKAALHQNQPAATAKHSRGIK